MSAKSMNALLTGRIQKRKTNPLHRSDLACNTRPVHTVGSVTPIKVACPPLRGEICAPGAIRPMPLAGYAEAAQQYAYGPKSPDRHFQFRISGMSSPCMSM